MATRTGRPAARVTISPSERTILEQWARRRAFGLQPHRSETFKLSRDPLFVQKTRDVVGLDLDPPDGALVLSVDEKSQIQALDRTARVLPMTFGSPERRTHDVERWFALLSQKQIKRGAHRSVRALETAIRDYLAITNDAPKPFVWTKSADEILAKVARLCQRTSNPGH